MNAVETEIAKLRARRDAMETECLRLWVDGKVHEAADVALMRSDCQKAIAMLTVKL